MGIQVDRSTVDNFECIRIEVGSLVCLLLVRLAASVHVKDLLQVRRDSSLHLRQSIRHQKSLLELEHLVALFEPLLLLDAAFEKCVQHRDLRLELPVSPADLVELSARVV